MKSTKPTSEEIARLHKAGFLYYKEFVTGNDLRVLRRAFKSNLKSASHIKTALVKVKKRNVFTSLFGFDSFLLKKIPGYRILYSDFLREFHMSGKSYSNPITCFNHVTHWQKSFPTTDAVSGIPHWDYASGIKTWIYLEDCLESNGPLRIETSSHYRNHSIRSELQSHSKQNNMVFSYSSYKTSNFVDDFQNLIPVNYKAGDLIVFNTDCSHAASPIVDDSRSIVRTMTYWR